MKTKYITITLIASFAMLFIVACSKEDETSHVVLNRSSEPVLPASPYDYSFSGGWSSIDNNRATLGRVLFYDKVLSINNTVACADCHKQSLAFADNLPFSIGYANKSTLRNSMAIINENSGSGLFWDLRESSLNSMVLKPIQNHIEMGFDDMTRVVQKIKGIPYYTPLFQKAFGSSGVNSDNIAEAIAEFVRALHSSNSKYDKYIHDAGGISSNPATSNLLNPLEKEGYDLFFYKLPCNDCHQGSDLGGWDWANIGLEMNYKDKGVNVASRFIGIKQGFGSGIASNSESTGEGFFKIPSLRNIQYTAPYMHDGRFATLEEVVEHYNSGIQNHKNLDWRLKTTKDPSTGERTSTNSPIKLNLTDHDKQALVAFLHTLSDPVLISDPKYSNPFRLK